MPSDIDGISDLGWTLCIPRPHTSWIMIPGPGCYPCLDCFIFHTQLDILWWFESCSETALPLYIHILILTEEAKFSDCIIQSVFDCSDVFMIIQILVLPNFDCSGEEGTGLCESVTNVANAHDILFLPDPIFGSVICLCINWINKSFPELYTLMSLIIHISFTPILNFSYFSSFSFQNPIMSVEV